MAGSLPNVNNVHSLPSIVHKVRRSIAPIHQGPSASPVQEPMEEDGGASPQPSGASPQPSDPSPQPSGPSAEPMALQLTKAPPGQPASSRCTVIGRMHGVAPSRGAILQRKFREIPEVGSRGVGSAEKGHFSAEEPPNGSGSAQGARKVSLEAHACGVTKSQTPKKFPETPASQGGGR